MIPLSISRLSLRRPQSCNQSKRRPNLLKVRIQIILLTFLEEYTSELTNTKSDSNEINRENSPPMEIENNKGENSNISFPINQEMLDHLQNIEENLKISDETDMQNEGNFKNGGYI